jgi:CSLREA domain-containing protein
MSTQGQASAGMESIGLRLPARTGRRTALAAALGLALVLLLPATVRAATLTVTTTADTSDGGCKPSLCSFRDALEYAETGDTIILPAGTYKGTKLGGNGVWSPTGEYTVQGAGAGKTIIDGNGLSRTFALYGHVTMTGVTVTGGKGPFAGCTCGGAFEVRQGGFLTLTNSVVQGNSAPGGGGGIDVDSESNAVLQNVLISQNTTASGGGGGIRVEPVGAKGGTLKMTNVTISGNSTTGSSGAGLDNEGETTATNVTFTGNASAGEGGGVLNASTGMLTLNAATIAADLAAEKAAGIDNLAAAANVRVRNTIVTDGCSGAASPAVASQGHNLDAGNTCGFAALGDLINKNPLLGPLANNGGPTELPTLALGVGSPALEAGDNATCPTTDERGLLRPHGPVCDIGAFEYSPPIVATSSASGVTTSEATVGGTVNPSGLDAKAQIEYGTTTAYGSSTAAQDVGAGSGPVAVTAALSGLAPGATFHYRVVATNSDGKSASPDASFVTPSAPVFVPPGVVLVPPVITGLAADLEARAPCARRHRLQLRTQRVRLRAARLHPERARAQGRRPLRRAHAGQQAQTSLHPHGHGRDAHDRRPRRQEHRALPGARVERHEASARRLHPGRNGDQRCRPALDAAGALLQDPATVGCGRAPPSRSPCSRTASAARARSCCPIALCPSGRLPCCTPWRSPGDVVAGY